MRSRLLVIIYGVPSLPFIKTLITDVHTRACKELEYIHGEDRSRCSTNFRRCTPLSCRVQRYGGNVRTIQTSIYKVARLGYVGTPNLPRSVTLLVFGTLQPRGHVNPRKSRSTTRATAIWINGRTHGTTKIVVLRGTCLSELVIFLS